MILAIIPARCGSKGIPYKNIYPINNKPMISYSIETLKQTLVHNIYVSTDCDEIKNISMLYGASVIDRPKAISSDTSKTIECIKHSISFLQLSDEDIVVLVQPTSPLTLSEDINNGLSMIISNKYDCVISATENHSILWTQNSDNLLSPKDHNPSNRIRRQDMTKVFAETGSFYIFRVSNIRKYYSLYGNNVGFVEMPKSRSFEIDSLDDIKIIEAIIKYGQNNT